jgi:hypothetical protein
MLNARFQRLSIVSRKSTIVNSGLGRQPQGRVQKSPASRPLLGDFHGLTPVFAACYKEVLYVFGRYGQVVFPCCQATRNGYSDAAKLNPVWKWKRVRNSGPSPAGP